MSTAPAHSFYRQTRVEVSNTDAPLVRLFCEERVKYDINPALTSPHRCNLATLVQRICANNAHLGLTEDMSIDAFTRRYIQARAQVFAQTLEAAVQERTCVHCARTFRRIDNVGRMHCRHHPGHATGPRSWSCCEHALACTPCDHTDVDDMRPFVILHVALVPMFAPLRKHIVCTPIAPAYVLPDGAMLSAEAKHVAGADMLVYVRIKCD